jgi:peptidyl-prolyl cis-trans isomerase SurA
MLSQAEIDSLPLDDDRVEAEIDNRIRNFQRQAGALADFERYLGKSFLKCKEHIRAKMREQLLAQEMQSKIVGNLKISPKEVQQYYDRIPEDSLPVINTEVEVAQLLVELPISSVAEEFAQQQLEGLRKRILKGESFEKLARAYSMDPGSKANGGMLPEFGRGEMVGEFERVAFKLKSDSISQVFKSDFGYHVMKLIKRQGERILAAHILIRPENTSDDYLKASNTADTLYKKLVEGSIEWCEAVKKNSSEDFGNRGYCGFITDENTGMQKRLFESLPSDVKLVVDKLKPGEFSKPAVMVMPDGRTMYRIIYLRSFVAPHKANLVQDYSRIQMEAESEKRQQIIDKWVDGTRKKTYIRINTRNLDCGKISRWNNE